MRTFIAIEIPPSLKQRLRMEQQYLQARLQSCATATAANNVPRVLRWTNTENLHLTLRFLGTTEDAQRRQIQARLAAMAAEQKPFTLAFSKLGCFASWNKLRVLWMGISGETLALQTLQAEIETLAQQTGFVAQKKQYSPHITLARSVRGTSPALLRLVAAQLRHAAADKETAQPLTDWTVRELCHIRSIVGQGGSQYSTLARFSLGTELDSDVLD